MMQLVGNCQQWSCKCDPFPSLVLIFSYSYGTGTLTDVFLDRVFQECLTYEGEMVSLIKIILSENS